jgi:lysozyme
MKAATKTVTWAAACCSLVAAFEGCDFTAKKDMIGTGHPLTWCHGETIGNARAGQKFTRAECDAMLTARLPTYWTAIEHGIKVQTSNNEKIAFTSFTYNLGPGAFLYSNRKTKTPSVILRHLNAGDHKGACNALMQYTHASGKFVQGLWNRRDAERKICLTPDSQPDVEALRVAVIPKAHEKPATALVVTPPAPKPAPKMFSWNWWMEA